DPLPAHEAGIKKRLKEWVVGSGEWEKDAPPAPHSPLPTTHSLQNAIRTLHSIKIFARQTKAGRRLGDHSHSGRGYNARRRGADYRTSPDHRISRRRSGQDSSRHGPYQSA